MSIIKRQKMEDFIGWKSPDGKLEVIGIHQESVNGKSATFKVICTECSKDTELFPDGYFISTKGHLLEGKKPCGCSSMTKWKDWQYLILARRSGEGRFIVHGFSEKFKGAHTKLNLECLKDGNKWTANINSITGGKGCHKCFIENQKTPINIVIQKCISICKEMDYKFIGFPNGYKNSKSVFDYLCPKHGIQTIRYDSFVNGDRRCKYCNNSGYDHSKQGSFYIVKWTNGYKSFIKFGITNRDIISRIEEQIRGTEYTPEILWTTTFNDGKLPLEMENTIKKIQELISELFLKRSSPMGLQRQL